VNNFGLNLSKEKRLKISLLVGVLIIGFLLSIFFRFNNFQELIEANPNLTVLISLLIYALLGMTFIPTSPVTLLLAVLIGPLMAALVAIVGNTVSALVEYKVGGALGDIFGFMEKKSRLPFNLGDLPIHSPYVLLFGRLVPGGVRGISYVAGAYQVQMDLFLITTITMNTLSAFFIAYGGERLISLIW
jgi:uncharacterized membrane protein YdjX (TVP38/TMEM64 family)